MADTKATASVATQFLAAFVANIISLATGYVVGWNAVSLPVLESNGTAGMEQPLDRPLSKGETSWMITLVTLISATGPSLCSLLSHRWGFKPAGYVAGSLVVLGGVIVLLAHSFPLLMLGRVVTCLGTGCTVVVSTTYINGAAEDQVRGALGTFFALMFNAGILVAYLVGATSSYRIVCTGCFVIPLLYLICFFFLPESPQYLLSRGREDKAEKSLRWFRSAGHDVAQELERLRADADARTQDDGRTRMSLAEFLRDRACRLSTVTAIVLNLNQSLNGSPVVLSYVVQMFSEAENGVSAGWSAVVVAALQLLATFLSSALVDRAGRRPLLLATNAGMALCLAALGGYFFAKDGHIDVTAVWWLPVAAMSLLLVLNAIGIGALLYVVINESFSPEALPIAASIGFTAHTFIVTAVIKSYVVLLDWLGLYGCYWFFATCCILSNVYIFFFLPETMKRPIADIISELSGETKKKQKKLQSSPYDRVPVAETKT
ncbi:facilitated trehalose transporter Tret1-like [Schistocerca nitens]|uniref:facilitated trehalose transporter Tret1-like n=1 Tax=Schistocerca nitens TaxID=7011 RepID=UPI0021196DF7|nr:facilitated trehalose transporter Tret1-like [Schistocerca nitens]